MPLITIWWIFIVCIKNNDFFCISRSGVDGVYVQLPKSLSEISVLYWSEWLILEKQDLMFDKMCRNFITQVIRYGLAKIYV
jgi:hypothetical protein